MTPAEWEPVLREAVLLGGIFGGTVTFALGVIVSALVAR